MKKFSVLIIAMALSVNAFAQRYNDVVPECISGKEYSDELVKQKEKDYSVDIEENEIGLYVDYTKTDFDGLIFSDFVLDEGYTEETWANDPEMELERKFAKKANEELKKLNIRIMLNKVCRYMLKICFYEFDDDHDAKASYFLVDTQSGNLVTAFKFNSDSGMFGSTVNLMGDTFENAGETFGEELKYYIKKARKGKK